MIRKIFIDSDIILDVATGRLPFVSLSKECLSLIEKGKAIGVISSNSVTNIYYILRKIGSADRARQFLRTIIKYITVLSVDHESIKKALDSKFLDFEDGVQNYCALRNQCDLILTRNTKDYSFSELMVLEPKEFLALYIENV
jgi:predicted nucleic acid-binding protein